MTDGQIRPAPTGVAILDINQLLAGEQASLLRALFARTPARAVHLAAAAGFAEQLRASRYPHRCTQRMVPA